MKSNPDTIRSYRWPGLYRLRVGVYIVGKRRAGGASEWNQPDRIMRLDAKRAGPDASLVMQQILGALTQLGQAATFSFVMAAGSTLWRRRGSRILRRTLSKKRTR
jgi:hypothetical protein